MYRVVQIKLGIGGKILPFDARDLDVSLSDYCVVEGEQGEQYGFVVGEPQSLLEEERPRQLRKVVRKCTDEDLSRIERNRTREKEAFQICQKKMAERQLAMKLVGAERIFDGSKIIFYFTAEGRVDFRGLVKDLAQVFRTRIELRQIGVRDESKMLGGIGCCGRQLCCASFLRGFEPVSIRMARDQRLSLNPEKISGLCGRLMCCLGYEVDTYREMGRGLPRDGSRVNTDRGAGKVVGGNVLKRTVVVELESGQHVEIPAEQVERVRSGPAPRPRPKREGEGAKEAKSAAGQKRGRRPEEKSKQAPPDRRRRRRREGKSVSPRDPKSKSQSDSSTKEFSPGREPS